MISHAGAVSGLGKDGSRTGRVLDYREGEVQSDMGSLMVRMGVLKMPKCSPMTTQVIQ